MPFLGAYPIFAIPILKEWKTMAKQLRLVHDADADHTNMPDLSGIHGFKGVHALCSVDRQSGRLQATHYAICLSYGREPLWGVWLVSGKFVRFAGSKTQVEKAYPRLVWRRKMAEWNLNNVDDLDVKKRKQYLKEMYK